MKKILFYLLAVVVITACNDQIVEEELTIDEKTSTITKSQTLLNAKESKKFKANGFIVFASESSANIEDEITAAKGNLTRKVKDLGMYVVQSQSADFADKMLKVKSVEAVLPDFQTQWIKPETSEIDYFTELNIGADEMFYGDQWSLRAINAVGAWDKGYTGKGVKVFVLDSGIDAEHPDLSPNLNTALSVSFVPGEDYNIQPGFYFNHGTHVAGTIAAADGPDLGFADLGVIGVAPDAEIVAVKVLSEYTGTGAFSWIYSGVVYAANNGADIINMSLGTELPRNGFDVELPDGSIVKVKANEVAAYINYAQKAITYAYQKGSLVIVAASNDGLDANHTNNLVFIPASLNHLVTVSATAPEGIALDPNTNLDIPASYTNYGQSLIDIAAPGGDFDFPGDFWWEDMVLSTISNGWGYSAGTSMAAPHAAGTAALIIEKLGGEFTPTQVMRILEKSSDDLGKPGKDAYYGHGRINAANAVE